MEKILSWLESFKSFFSSEVAKISAAQAELVTVKAELATANTSLSERDAKIVSLTADLEKAQNEVNAKGTEVQSLTAELATEKGKTTEALAGQGIDPTKLPAGGNGESKTTQQQIDAIRERMRKSNDPKEKSTLAREIKALLTTSKN